MRLFEKYRPTTLADVVGQPKACAQVQRAIELGLGGRALWFTGPSGSGKTTLARIAARAIADDWMIEEFDSGADLGAAELSRLVDMLQMYGAGRGGRAVIVNESHSLRADIIDRLKGVLERIPGHAVWCFTTATEDQDKLFEDHVGAAQLLSRCTRVSLTGQGLATAGAVRLMQCAKAEGLDGMPESAYVKLMQRPDVKNNLRAAFNLIEGGAMKGGAL